MAYHVHDAGSMRSVLFHGVAIVFAIAVGCTSGTGDQSCPPGFDPNDKSDECPFGPPGGPKVRESGCPDIAIDESGPDCGALGWEEDIFPLLTSKAPATQNCSSDACHDPPNNLTPAGGIRMPRDDAQKSFDTLKSYELGDNYPYMSDTAPSHTWILCNLSGAKGGSQPMPPPPLPLIDAADFSLVKTWAECGQKRNRPGGGTGGGGP